MYLPRVRTGSCLPTEDRFWCADAPITTGDINLEVRFLSIQMVPDFRESTDINYHY